MEGRSLERERYKRHLILPDVGEEGQEKLRNGRVLVVGAGGLGSPVCLYLAAAGVGTIGIADFDRVDISNLQRQVLYCEKDVGKRKAEAAAERLRQMNSTLKVLTYGDGVTKENISQIIEGYDVIVDASDNFRTRYLLSDACVRMGKPDVYGAICEFSGQVTVFTKDGPCLRCLSPDEPETEVPEASGFGVLGAIPGVIGCIQAAEVLKLLLGTGDSLVGRMLFVDLKSMSFDEMEIGANPRCTCAPFHRLI